MALGRAFIEVHADLTPFKKDLGSGVAKTIAETQKAVKAAVDEAVATESDKPAKAARPRKIKIKAELDTTDVDKDSDRAGKSLRSRLEQGMKGAMNKFNEFWDSSGATRNAIIGGLVGAGIVASPMIGATIAGGIAAAIGLGGIGAGVALALRDSRIKGAVNGLGKFIMSGLEKSSESFIAPLGASIGILRAAFDRFFPRLEAGFAKIAPYVSELAYGIGGFLDKLGPGLESAFGNSGPFLQIVADYLPVIGEALAYMFTQISESEGARAGLTFFFQALGDIIVMTTDALTWLSDRFATWLHLMDKVPDALMPDGWAADIDEMIASMELMPAAAGGATAGMFGLGGAAGGAAQKTRDLTASLDTFFGKQLGWVDSQINFEAAIDRVSASFKENGRNIDITTEKGRNNVSTVQAAIRSAISMRDAKIKETGSVAAGNAVYTTQIEKLRGVLTKAHLTQGQIETLIGAYDALPPEVSTEVAVPGLASALSQAQMLNYELSRIQSDNLHAKRNKGGTNGVGGLAEGGIVTKEHLTWIGEGNRPEAVIPLTNPGRAAEIMSEAGLMGFGGGGTIVVQMMLDGRVIDERVIRAGQADARSLQQRPRMI